jgi:hypothetical protein
MPKGLLVIIAALTFVLNGGDLGLARVYYTKEEALKLAFPEAETIKKKTIFLDKENKREIEALARLKIDSSIYIFYLPQQGQDIIGYALFGSRIVRTNPLVYMIVINLEGNLKEVRVLASYEAEEYLPPRSWLEQFRGRILDDNLWPKRGLTAISGATLSVHAITQEVRKTLSVFKIINSNMYLEFRIF